VIEAAGGLVWRPSAEGGVEVLVVHRPRYDDWSLPKGKLGPGEAPQAAAVREVAEETGLSCAVGRPLPEIRYLDHRGRPKRVRYWTMTPLGGDFTPNAEVDEVRWLERAAAADLLTYEHDAALVRALPADPARLGS